MILINKPYLVTKLPIWSPKYHTDSGEWEVWIACKKVAYASPVIIVEFTKAKHLMSQRFAVRRQDVERCERGTNGRIEVYKVPFDLLEDWQTYEELFKEEEYANN